MRLAGQFFFWNSCLLVVLLCSKLLIMATKKPSQIFQFILGVILLSFVTACNSSSEKTETTDTTTIKTDTMPPAMTAPVDTMKMDTATTRPVKEVI